MRRAGQVGVGDDDRVRPAQRPGASSDPARQQTAAYDLVAALAEADGEALVLAHVDAPSACAASASSTRLTTACGRIAAVHHQVRLGIDRRPLLQQFGEPGAVVALREERPFARAAGAPDQRVEVRVQPDRERPGAHQRPGGRIHERATAERQDLLLLAEQAAAITRRSFSRNAASPISAKMLLMVVPAASSIAASASWNGQPRILARRLPTAVLPAPIIPIRTTVRSIGGAGRCGPVPSAYAV